MITCGGGFAGGGTSLSITVVPTIETVMEVGFSRRKTSVRSTFCRWHWRRLLNEKGWNCETRSKADVFQTKQTSRMITGGGVGGGGGARFKT